MKLALTVTREGESARTVVDLSTVSTAQTHRAAGLVGWDRIRALADGWNADAARALLYVLLDEEGFAPESFEDFAVTWPFPDTELEASLPMETNR